MSSQKKFITVCEYCRKGKIFFPPRMFLKELVFSCIVITSLIVVPSTIFAKETLPSDTQENISTASTTEGLLASTEQMIEQLIRQIDLQQDNTLDKGELADNPNPTSYFSSIPNIRPTGGKITSIYGIRVHPVYHVPLFHSGIDFSVPEGTRVQSTGDGIVAFSGYDKGYGQKITVNHGYGFKTIYAHLSKSFVRQGQKIKRGDIIALSGNTGVSTGPHMHYEVHKNNVIVNPTAYFFDENNPDKFITIQKTSPEQEGNNS